MTNALQSGTNTSKSELQQSGQFSQARSYIFSTPSNSFSFPHPPSSLPLPHLEVRGELGLLADGCYHLLDTLGSGDVLQLHQQVHEAFKLLPSHINQHLREGEGGGEGGRDRNEGK